MRVISVLICCLMITCAATAQVQQPKLPSKADLSKMDFWVGDWKLNWQNGEGTNHIVSKYGGRVIQENFKVTEGPMKGYEGTSISTYNPNSKKWHQAWADSKGGYFNFIGQMEGETRIFYLPEKRTMPNGQSILLRMRFSNIKENELAWDWEQSLDDGKTWQTMWRINYVRIGS